METKNILHDIAKRCDGDIYLGVVGPVRSGKSSFIKRFMEMAVIPYIEDKDAKLRAIDELPQSGKGKMIMTVEPKFIPNQAVEMLMDENFKTYTLCNPLTVRINHNSRLTEYIAKYKVCCFSARSGKTCQVLHCIGYFPTVNVNKPLTTQDYIFRLVAVKSRRFYIFTKLVIIRICKIFCIPILFKKCFGNYINSCVGTLCRHLSGNKHFKRCCVIKRTFDIGICLVQKLSQFQNSFFLRQRNHLNSIFLISTLYNFS